MKKQLYQCDQCGKVWDSDSAGVTVQYLDNVFIFREKDLCSIECVRKWADQQVVENKNGINADRATPPTYG